MYAHQQLITSTNSTKVARKMISALWITRIARNLFLPKQTLKSYKNANIKLSVIDSTLRHALKLTVAVDNLDKTKKLPPDVHAKGYFYFDKAVKGKDQIRNLKITEILKPDTQLPEPTTLKQSLSPKQTILLYPPPASSTMISAP